MSFSQVAQRIFGGINSLCLSSIISDSSILKPQPKHVYPPRLGGIVGYMIGVISWLHFGHFISPPPLQQIKRFSCVFSRIFPAILFPNYYVPYVVVAVSAFAVRFVYRQAVPKHNDGQVSIRQPPINFVPMRSHPRFRMPAKPFHFSSSNAFCNSSAMAFTLSPVIVIDSLLLKLKRIWFPSKFA